MSILIIAPFFFLALTIFAILKFGIDGTGLFIISSALAIISFGVSFGAPHGNPVHVETSAYRLEKTPYRVIITAFDKETVFTDAYTVARADQIVAVRKSIPKNVWGIELDSSVTIKPVFAGDLPESK